MTPDPAAATIELHRFDPDGEIPNNERLPLAVYRGVLPQGDDPAAACERLFAGHGWGDSWRNGIYDYHHFHSTAHEVLGIVRGEARVRFGGPNGASVAVAAGDVVVIPAGVGHKREAASADLLVIGAYPDGQSPDIRRPQARDRNAVLAAIVRVPGPAQDPVFGPAGPLLEHWPG